MSPSESPAKELDEKYVEIIVKFVSDIRSGKLEGSNNIALATVNLLEQIIIDSQNATAFELCSVVRECGRRLCRALPQHAAGNMVRRVLRAIRDEQRTSANQGTEGAGESLQRLVLAAPSRRNTLPNATRDLREPLRDHIAELRLELESTSSSLCQQAREHVHADELVLTYGASELAESFLKAASKRCRVIVAESDNVAESEAMSARLSTAGIAVTVISSAAVWAVMSRVNKVIVSVEATMSGGDALAASGMAAVACAAKYYSVPVIALSPLSLLTPLYSCEQQQVNCLLSPQRTLPYEGHESAVASALAPRHDCVRADQIALFVTNLGGSSPSYIYRLLAELYDPKDYQL